MEFEVLRPQTDCCLVFLGCIFVSLLQNEVICGAEILPGLKPFDASCIVMRFTSLVPGVPLLCSVAKSLLPDFGWMQSKHCQGFEALEGPGDLS